MHYTFISTNRFFIQAKLSWYLAQGSIPCINLWFPWTLLYQVASKKTHKTHLLTTYYSNCQPPMLLYMPPWITQKRVWTQAYNSKYLLHTWVSFYWTVIAFKNCLSLFTTKERLGLVINKYWNAFITLLYNVGSLNKSLSLGKSFTLRSWA